MNAIRRILFATDFSRSSEEAGGVAMRLAEQMSAAVDLVNVIDTGPACAASTDVADRAGRIMEIRQHARDDADEFIERHMTGGPLVLVHLRDGIPATEIIAAAGELHCGLIVMGTHGRTGLDHLLMGSVAESVIRRSPIPVVTVRGIDR